MSSRPFQNYEDFRSVIATLAEVAIAYFHPDATKPALGRAPRAPLCERASRAISVPCKICL